MTENFIFRALIISLAAHTAVLSFAYIHRVKNIHYHARAQHRIEITYKPFHRKKFDLREYPVKPAQRLDLLDSRQLLSDGTIPVARNSSGKSMLPFGMVYERKLRPMQDMELSRRISIMPISSQKINNPVYGAYNEIVRERIKERVYANYDKIEMGSVYLTFLLDDHGVLKDARIVPEKTNAPEHLQEIALRSLREASPFPPFLKGMSLKEYPFNIEIQYQVSED